MFVTGLREPLKSQQEEDAPTGKTGYARAVPTMPHLTRHALPPMMPSSLDNINTNTTILAHLRYAVWDEPGLQIIATTISSKSAAPTWSPKQHHPLQWAILRPSSIHLATWPAGMPGDYSSSPTRSWPPHSATWNSNYAFPASILMMKDWPHPSECIPVEGPPSPCNRAQVLWEVIVHYFFLVIMKIATPSSVCSDWMWFSSTLC